MKNYTFAKKQAGFTLIETGIALAIGLIVIVGALILIKGSMKSANVSTAINDIAAIESAATQWRAGRTGYTGISMTELSNQKLIPDALGTTGANANPWGGNYSVAADPANSTKVNITLTNVPAGLGARVASKFNNGTANNGSSVSGTTVTINY